MYTGLSRKNKYFTPEMTDELNASLKEVDSKIEAHVATPLKPKLKVTPVHNYWNGNNATDRSCRIGYEFVLDATVDVSNISANEKTLVGRVNSALVYTVVSTCYGKERPYRLVIEDSKVYIVSSIDVSEDVVDINENLIVLV